MPDNPVLATCLGNIRQHARLMRDHLADGQLLQALKNCSNFLNELRTSAFSPKEYYELYMAVFDALESLSAHLLQSHKSKQAKGKNAPFLTDLYEMVQYSGNIIPRLYMMIVVGTTCMAAGSDSTKDIMKDMMEMCRGVQHPVRGLFLRHYLGQRTKDLFPMKTRDEFGETVDFLVTNFVEMNKLWVRLQHQGHSSERELRYQERKELKILVGSNLVRLSQVVDDFSAEGYSPVEFYTKELFPAVTEQIIQCRDHLAQSYLVDVLIQIFPDSFHLATLDELLNGVFIKLHPMLSRAQLVETLVDRFVTFKEYEGMESLSVDDKTRPALDLDAVFSSFWKFYADLQKADPPVPVEESVAILQSLIKLSLTFDAANFRNLDKIYQLASEALKSAENKDSQALWMDLLTVPIDHFSSVVDLLKLPFYYELYSGIDNPELQKSLSFDISQKLLDSETQETLATTDEIDTVFKYLTVLISDADSDLNTSKDLGVELSVQVGEKHYTESFLHRQENVCKALHLVDQEDQFKCLSNLLYVKKKYLNKAPKNLVYTYPTLVAKMTNVLRVAGYRLLAKAKNDKDGNKSEDNDHNDLLITSNFKNISVCIEELYRHHQQHHSELVLKLYLNLASTADQLRQQHLAYELFTQCFVVYEESIILGGALGGNPHASMGGGLPYQSVVTIANHLAQSRYFSKDNYEALITKATLYGSKLLKKQDQCRSIYYCAHLWWWCDVFIEGPSPTVEEEEQKKEKEENDEEGEKNENDEKGEEEVENENEKEEKEPVLYRDPRRVLECLQKALRVADACMDPYLSLKLFVEILNRCLIFSIYGNPMVDSRYINGLIDLIRTNLANFEGNQVGDDDEEARLLKRIEEYFDRTLQYVGEQQATEDRFPDIVV